MSFNSEVDIALDIITQAFSSDEKASFYDSEGAFEKDIVVIFDENSIELNEDGQAANYSQNPEITVRKSILGHDPIEDARVDFRGKQYTINEFIDDGLGSYSIQLNLAFFE